jgi:hypothetical protein
VKNRFQNLPFKFNLQRYSAAGRCTLNSVDPWLESDWFQTLTLEHVSWPKRHVFQIQPAPLQRGALIQYAVPYSEHSSFEELRELVGFLRPRAILPHVGNDRGGALQVESS